MSKSRQIQINVTRGPGGLNYSADKLPKGEQLVATMTYETAVRGPRWFLQKIVTAEPTIMEYGASDESGVVSLEKVEQCIFRHEESAGS